MHLYRKNLCLPPGQNLDFWYEPGRDVITHQVGQSLFLIEWVTDTTNMRTSIFDADKQCSAGGICERNDGL